MATCSRCHGEGFISFFPDDMCRGAGECFHGDGEMVCPSCNGEGEVGPYEYEDGVDG